MRGFSPCGATTICRKRSPPPSAYTCATTRCLRLTTPASFDRLAHNAKGNSHPAQYPAELAEWIVRLLCPEFGVVLDPFMGVGSTAEGVLRAGGERKYIGIEVNAQYCREAEARIKEFLARPSQNSAL